MSMNTKNKYPKKSIAIFDIDGTIFRSSLLIELQLDLVKYGIFPEIARKELEGVYIAWLNRKGSYDRFISEVIASYRKRIAGCHEKDVKEVAKLVIRQHKERVYKYSRELIKKLRKNYLLIAISGSPREIVREFNRYWKFNEFFATQYEIGKNRQFTGNILYTPVGNKKNILLNFVKENNLTLINSLGIGDSESDISFLELVSRPIAFNPNNKLYITAKRRHWEVVVERKDVIYFLPRL